MLQAIRRLLTRPECFRLEREFAGPDFHRGGWCTLARHTNNGSDRALRPCAVYRKITNGLRQESGARLYADIGSVIETARRRSIRAIDAIRLTLRSEPLQTSA